MKLTAIVIGATGLCGNELLNQLLENDAYVKVITLSRKQIEKEHPKHSNHLVDLFDPDTYSKYLEGDHLFICTGTTQAKTPDPDAYYRIEHDLPLEVAEQAKTKGVNKVVAISALGANPESSFAYNRGKGDMERDIEALNFEEAYFVQPALIGGSRAEKRTFESAWKKFQKLIDPLLLGPLRKYRTIEPETIASAMIKLALMGYSVSRIESDELKKIAGKSE